MKKIIGLVLPALLLAQPFIQAQNKKPTAKASTKPVSPNSTGSSSAKKQTGAATNAKPVITDSIKATVKKEDLPPAKTAPVTTVAYTAPVVSLPAKDKPAPPKEAVINPFSKGTISFINRKNIDYSNTKNTGIDNYKLSDFLGLIDVHYFFMNNLAIGLNVTARNSSSKAIYSSSKTTYYFYSAMLNLTYGRVITPKVAAYIRIAAGIGNSRSVSNVSSNTRLDANYQLYKLTIGAPLSVLPGSPVFLTPYASYNYQKTKAQNHDITDKGFSFGARFESYITTTGTKTGNKEIGAWPRKGASFVEFESQGNFGFSKRIEYQGTVRFADVKTKSGSFGLGYHYYFLDYLAAGINIALSYTNRNNGSPDVDKVYSIEPSVTAHLPTDSKARNLFLQLGYRFEHENSNGTKINTGYFASRIGYNVFLNRFISFSPKIGYDLNHSTHSNSNGVKFKTSGLAVDFGFRCWIK